MRPRIILAVGSLFLLLGALVGCSADEGTAPQANDLAAPRLQTYAPTDFAPEADRIPFVEPKLSEVGIDGLVDQDKAVRHICATDVWGYFWDITVNNGVVTGTVNTGPCGIYTVSGTPTHLRADIQVPQEGCVSFDYFVEFLDRPNRTVSGSWRNDAGASGTWSATGGPCP
jgi:hypothetical protein